MRVPLILWINIKILIGYRVFFLLGRMMERKNTVFAKLI